MVGSSVRPAELIVGGTTDNSMRCTVAQNLVVYADRLSRFLINGRNEVNMPFFAADRFG